MPKEARKLFDINPGDTVFVLEDEEQTLQEVLRKKENYQKADERTKQKIREIECFFKIIMI